MKVHIYTSREVQKVLDSGRIAYDTHMRLAEDIKPGISTYELDGIAREYIKKQGGRPAFLGYEGYPASICTSVNSQVVHGIPKKNDILQEGDILGIDLGVLYNDYYSDTAWTWPVGKVSEKARKLITTAQECLYHGIQMAVSANRIGHISYTVQKHAESRGYSVVRYLVGHGIGKNLHEEPQVPNFGKKKDGPKIRAGMIIAIEPMVNEGSYEVITEEDGWTMTTSDGKLSAHFEHTIAVTSEGPTICTLPRGAKVNVFDILDPANSGVSNPERGGRPDLVGSL